MNTDRFHIVVFNYERIGSFLDNFDKVTNFDPQQDKIFILDCSRNHKLQQQKVIEFSQQKGWNLGKQIHFVRRKNWGIDQGGRIDYFSLLHQSFNKPKYIWQFQEHYLDLKSVWSFYEQGTYNIDGRDFSGQIKGDVIPDELVIDLNACEHIYEMHPQVSIVYADRLQIGIFPYTDREFFYIDGANFSIRTSYALEVFDQSLLANLKSIYDSTYKWALFIEFIIGCQLTRKGGTFFDLVSHYYFHSPQQLKTLESENNTCLHQIAEEQYAHLYRQYEQKYLLLADAKTLNKQLYKMLFRGQNFLRSIYTLLKKLIKIAIQGVSKLFE
jgi:hypothetical protein